MHRGEARAGNLVKWLLLALGVAALLFTGQGRMGPDSIAACVLYGLLSLAFTLLFLQPHLPAAAVNPTVLVSYLTDLAFVAFLTAATGGLTSDLYILFTPLALKAAVYYPAYPTLLMVTYLIAPLYALALRFAAGGWYFLLDSAFYPRYVLLFGILFTATYMAWLFGRRQQHIEELTENLNAKAQVLEETATGLGDRVIELRTLQEGIKAINSALALEELLHVIVVNASQVLGVARCSVALLDEQAGEVVTRAASGVPPEEVAGRRFKLGTGVAGLVVQTGRSILIGDVRKDARFVHSSEYPVVSVMCVPLISDNKPVGALTATSRKANAFTEDDLSLLAAFADQAAIAVKNAALYQRLGEEKRRTEAILQGLGDGVIVTDARLNVVMVNPMARHIFAVDRAPAGVPLKEIIAEAALSDLLLAACTNQSKPVMGEITLPGVRPDHPRVYHILATTVLDENGEVSAVIAVLRDITSRKELEDMKTSFLSVVSHELKTPLNSIKGFVDIILMGKTGRINDTQRDFLTIVKTQTNQLQNLINDLLEFSRLESGQVRLRIEDVALREVAAAVVEKLSPLAQSSQITLSCTIPEGFPVIQADLMRVEQVVTNLVDNAIKFTPTGGRVTIGGEDCGDMVEIAVSDTGIGIPPEEQSRVFDRFYQVDSSSTRAYRGTGLGLTICRHIVEQHHGHIWVESEQGRGSTFRFRLPKRTVAEAQEASLDFAAFPPAASH